VAALK